MVDRILGYGNLKKIEAIRDDKAASHSSLGEAKWSKQSSSDGYSSSYRNIKIILEAVGIKDGDVFVDIGSSYGRVGCVVGTNFPNVRFLGYEIVQERVAEAQRVAEFLQFENVNYFHTDISAEDFVIPEADWFFLYDSLNDKTLESILTKISKNKASREVHLIAKYTGDLNKYAKSPYLEFISKNGENGSFGECWLYRFK